MTRRRGRPADVVIVGAGPAGLAAAAAAAERGKRVLVVDQGLRPGGQIWRHRDERTLPVGARELLARVRAAGVTIAAEARLVDANGPHELLIDFRGRLDTQEAGALVLATGAKERFIPFPGWTLPGVLGVGGLQALLKGGLRLAGARVVVAGTGPLLLPVAASLAKEGVKLELVLEQATTRSLAGFAASLALHPGKLSQGAAYRWAFMGTPYRTDSWVMRAEGNDRVRSVLVRDRGRVRSIPCDWVATSAGLVPNTDLGQLLGCALEEDHLHVDAAQATTVPGVWAAGECTGVKGDDAGMVEGAIAGRAAAGDARGAADGALTRARNSGRSFCRRLAKTFALRPELLSLADADTIICRCEDVKRGAIDPAWSQRQAKLWTRVGMGACQGAVCGPACASLFGWDVNAVRPPLGAPACGAWGEALMRSAARDVNEGGGSGGSRG